jgi:hypothetical protein
MALNVGKFEQYQTNPFLGITTGSPVAVRGTSTQPVNFASKSYAAIPYEKAPVVTDTVPTKHADGTPFWNDYVTPNKVWTC